MFITLVARHGERIYRVILSSVACLPLPYFFLHYIITDKIFRKKIWTWKACFGFLYNIFLKYLSFSEKLSEILSQIFICLHVKYPFFLSDFNETWISSGDFRKIHKCPFSCNLVQWDPGCSGRLDGRTEGETDITKLIVAFHNFTKPPKNRSITKLYEHIWVWKRRIFILWVTRLPTVCSLGKRIPLYRRSMLPQYAVLWR